MKKENMLVQSRETLLSKKMTVVRGWCVAIIAITSSLAMMHGDTTLVSEQVNRLMGIPNYISSIILIGSILIDSKSFKFYKPLVLYVVFGWFLMTFWFYEKIEMAPLTLIVMLLFCGVGERAWLFALDKYKLFLLVTSAYGILAYISFVLSLGLPHTTVPYYSAGEQMGWTYEYYYLALLVLNFDGLRLCGLFNEPGYFGTILALYLISQKVDLTKKENIIMFVAGCFTFSLAYFVLILLYYLVLLLKKPKYIAIAFLVALSIAFAIPYLARQNEMVGILIDRFSIEDGALAGDSRTTDRFDMFWNQMYREGRALFGYGHGYISSINAHSLSWKNFVLEYGYVGAFLMWGLLFSAAKKKARKGFMENVFLFLFFTSIYQRPSVYWVQYMLILFGGIISLKNSEKHENTNLCAQPIQRRG